MQDEARDTGKPDDFPLKILAHNNLVGRIIGKQVPFFRIFRKTFNAYYAAEPGWSEHKNKE